MAGIVDIGFNARVDGMKNVDQLLKQMREINKLTSVKISTNINEKQTSKELKQQQQKITLIRLERELIKAQNKDWAKSIEYINKLNKQLQQGSQITRDQWAELKLINDQEQQRLNLLIQQEKASQQVAKIKTADMNKLHTEALKMNKAYDANVKSQKKVENQSEKTKNKISELTKSYMSLRSAMRLKEKISQTIRELSSLDESMFNLGVVAGKTNHEIEKMKWELVELSTDFPQAATDIADAIDLVARTGLTFEDSMKTVKAGMILATASGESLESISSILAKSLVAFSLGGEEAADAINTFYSAVLKTPLSLEGLSQSMRNSASSFATLIDFTQKSGSEFEDYKEDLLELQVALTAGFAKLGLGASQSGTVIRGFVGRLISAEKTAVKLFDGLNLQFEGATLTFEKFSQIASEDVFKALDILSGNFDKLAKNRDLLKSLFTQRQWARIAPILSDMNGNTKEWVDNLVTGKDASKGMETQMEAFNNQLKKFNNNILSSKKVLLELVKDMGSAFLPLANDALEALLEMEDGFGKTAIQIAGMTSAIFVLQTALSSLAGLGGFSALAGLLANPILTATVLSMSAGVSAGILLAKQQQRELEEINSKIKEENEAYERQKEKIEAIRKETNLYKLELEDIGVESINKQWDDQIDLIAQSISKIKELNNSILDMRGINFISNITVDQIDAARVSTNDILKNFLDTEIAIENNKKAIKEYQKEINIIEYKESLEEPLSKDQIKRREELNNLIKASNVAINLNEESLKRYKKIIDNLRISEEELEKARFKGFADYKNKIDELSESLSDRDKSIKKLLAEKIVTTPADSYEEWLDNVKEFMPEIESIMRQFRQYKGEKIELVGSKNFKEMLPYLSFYKNEILSSNKILEDTDTKIDNIKNNTKITAEDKKMQLENEYKTQAVAKNNLKSSMEILKTIRDYIINARELKKTKEDETKLYIQDNRLLNELVEKNKVLTLSGIEALKAEEDRLNIRKEELGLVVNTYDKEKKGLDDIVQKYIDKGTTVKFVGDELQAEGKYAKDLTAEYETQKGKLEDIDKAKEDSARVDIDLTKNAKQQADYWEKQLKTILNYKNDLNNILSKDTSISDIRNKVEYTEEQINKEISEGMTLLENKKELSEKERNKLEEAIKMLKEQLGWIKQVKSEDEKIAGIREKQQLIGLATLQKLQIEQINIKKKLLETDKVSAEYAQLVYDLELNKTAILQENLRLEIAQNRELTNTVNMTSQLIDKMSGTNFSSIVNPLTELFKKGDKGKNLFQQFGGMFERVPTFTNIRGAGNVQTGTAMAGLSTSGMMAGLGMVGIGLEVVNGIGSILDEKEQKEIARYQEQLNVLKSQLSATEGLRDALVGYTKDLISELSELPTKLNAEMVAQQGKMISQYLTMPEWEITLLKHEGVFGGLGDELKGITFDINKALTGGFETEGDLGQVIFADFIKKGGDASNVVDKLDWIINTTLDDLDEMYIRNIAVGDSSEAWETLQASALAYKDTLAEIGVLSGSDALRQATFLGFEGVDFKSTSEYRSELENRFTELKELTGMTDQEFNTMIDSMMKDYEEISTNIAKSLRDGMIEGITAGRAKSESLLSGFKGQFETLSNDINKSLLDLQFGDVYAEIERLTIGFYKGLEANVEGAVGKPTTDYIKAIAEEASKLMEFEGRDIIGDAGELLIKQGYDLLEVIDQFGLTLEQVNKDQYDLLKMWEDGAYAWEDISDYLDDFSTGLMGATKDVFKAANFTDAFTSLGDYLGEQFSDSIIDNLTSSKFQQDFLSINRMSQDLLAEGITYSGLNQLRNEVSSFTARAEQERLQLESIRSVLSVDREYNYVDDTNRVDYQTSSTQQNVYNYNTTNAFNIGNLVSTKAELQAFATVIAPYVSRAQSEGRR